MTRTFTHPAMFLAAAAILAPAFLAGQTPGHADLCVFRGGRFLCDTAHDGGAAEVRVRFGIAGELPFLVDFEGDGRADPCVFRNRQFLCDVAHDGGAAELQSPRFDVFPQGAQPLLGDLYGDVVDGGATTPCYRSGSHWFCLVWNQIIGWHSISWDFGSGKDPGLLGDVDGDGAADVCVAQQGRFFCRIYQVQEGIYGFLTLNLRSALPAGAPGTPLLGDVNGDGQADPCVWNAGRLVCGIFPPGKSRPASIVRETFGMVGDIPLLGDIDGL